jgi:Glycosyl transferase family 2
MAKAYFLSVLAVFKNESHILKEWIEHYLQRGFDHFYLINDASTDNYKPVLEPFSNKVTLYQNEVFQESLGRQAAIYNKYGQEALQQSEWLAVLDLDEFLWSPVSLSLRPFFRKNQITQYIVDWQHFGSSRFVSQPSEVVDNFLWRAENKIVSGVKSIVFCEAVDSFEIHIHKMKFGGNKRIGWSQKEGYLLINHYAIQSLYFWLQVKGKRGDVNRYIETTARNIHKFKELDINREEDNRLALQKKPGLFFLKIRKINT